MDWFLYDNGLRHERFKNTYFETDLRKVASVIFQKYFPENLKKPFNLFCYIFIFLDHGLCVRSL